MEFQFLGGAREVGGNAFIVKNKSKIMLDYGVRIQPEPPTYPIPARADGVVLSHGHLDHCGALAALHKRCNLPIFMTDVSMEFTVLLLKDSLKIAEKEKIQTPFNARDVKKMLGSIEKLDYNHTAKFKEFKITLMDAGHIPGSAGILLETDGKRIFYTGDINTKDSHLLSKCHLPSDIDILITESTYSEREHVSRAKEEQKFIEHCEESIANHNTALIPSFAIGRSQEVLMILEKYADKIAIDGMVREATEIVMHHSKYVKDTSLKQILKKVFWVENEKDRQMALREMPLIVASAGMLSGGPALYYLREICDNPEAKVLFTGFLVDDSPGKILLETGKFHGNDKGRNVSYDVKCGVQRFDLSSHAGRSGLLKIIEKTCPKKVICVHGDNTPKFASEISQMFNIQAFAPKKGDILKI